MRGPDKQRAHELAQLATKWAAELQEGESFRMEAEPTMDGQCVKFTFWLTSSDDEAYTLSEEKVGDRPIGQSHPDSPSR